MGAVTPVISAVGALSSVAGGLVTAKQRSDTVRQDADLQKQSIKAQSQAEKEQRQAALRRAVARRRALFSANNVSMDGSGEAVLLGLYEETDEDLKKRDELDRIRQSSINNASSYAQTRSLLDAVGAFGTLGSNRSRYL